MKQRYSIDVFWSDEDELWIANVPDLHMCTGHGDTPLAAVSEVEVAVDVWLETVINDGRVPPTPSSRKFPMF